MYLKERNKVLADNIDDYITFVIIMYCPGDEESFIADYLTEIEKQVPYRRPLEEMDIGQLQLRISFHWF